MTDPNPSHAKLIAEITDLQAALRENGRELYERASELEAENRRLKEQIGILAGTVRSLAGEVAMSTSCHPDDCDCAGCAAVNEAAGQVALADNVTGQTEAPSAPTPYRPFPEIQLRQNVQQLN
jgi:hypothetical protein